MVQIIMGLKGSGKTKRLVDMVRQAVDEGKGDVVCFERDRNLTFDIPYQARLIEAGAYDVGNYEFLKGLICGVHAGNYDKFSANENIDFVISISADPAAAPESVRQYII